MRTSHFAYYSMVAVFVTWLGLVAGANAAVPATISYQGYLTEVAGTPIDQDVQITFLLYNVPSGGSPQWSETQTVEIILGLFSVELGGGVTPFPAGLFDNPLWLGIQVEADPEMVPRRVISSVGFAKKAEDSDSLQGQSASALDQTSHVVNLANPHNVGAGQTGAASSADLAVHEADSDAHHVRFTQSEAVAAILSADGSGSGLDADLLDGAHASAFAAQGDLDALSATVSALSATLGNALAEIVALQTANATLTAKLQYITVAGTDMYITGANLHIRDGSGTTTSTTGLGNLVVGYNAAAAMRAARGSKNESDFNRQVVRTGSHNLVVGDGHSYSSFGGLVAGAQNTVSGMYASVTGGQLNTASEIGASVSGGFNNTASGFWSSANGGWLNVASGEDAMVSGGYQNVASGLDAVVGGGVYNIASGARSVAIGGGLEDEPASGNEAYGNHSVTLGGLKNSAGESAVAAGGTFNGAWGQNSFAAGGMNNRATGDGASVTGGQSNSASGLWASVSGGERNFADGEAASISGGFENMALGDWSSAHGGSFNTAIGGDSSILGGARNTASGSASAVVGGIYNAASGAQAVAVGGGGPVGLESGNEAFADQSVVVGGTENLTGDPLRIDSGIGKQAVVTSGLNNIASGLAANVSGGRGNSAEGSYSSVSGGDTNTASGDWSSVSGGWLNVASGLDASISGGFNNSAENTDASVSGGENNVAAGARSSVSGGNGRTAAGGSDWVAGALFQDD